MLRESVLVSTKITDRIEVGVCVCVCVGGGGGGVLFSHRAAQDSVLPTPDKSGTYCLYLDQFRSLNIDASSLQQINLIPNQSQD